MTIEGLSIDPPARFSWALPALVAALVLWASAFPAIRACLEGYGPADLVALRLLVASVALGVYAALWRIRMPAVNDIGWFILTGLSGMTLYQISLSVGEMHVSAGSASLIVNTSPVIAVLLAAVFLKERIRWIACIGIGVSFAGAILIGVGESRGPGIHFQPDALFVLFSSVCSAVYVVWQKPMLSRYTPMEFTVYSVWFGSLFAAPWMPHALASMRHVAPLATILAVYLGLFPTAAAYAAWSFAFSRLALTTAISSLYLIPLFAIGISYFWLGEIPRPLEMLGGVLAILGVIVVTRGVDGSPQ